MTIDLAGGGELEAPYSHTERGGLMSPGSGIGSRSPADMVAQLVSQASSILSREAGRLPSAIPAKQTGPLGIPALASGSDGLLGVPQTPGSSFDPDRLRRQAHEMIETLLAAFSPRGPSPGVPLVRCVGPAASGHTASATLRVANDENAAVETTLYCSNFIADSGYDIPSVRVTVSPRKVTIPARGETSFDIQVAVPQQTPAGLYSGLIQATGATYVKAVLLVEVT
jgi:hypothetical protein